MYHIHIVSCVLLFLFGSSYLIWQFTSGTDGFNRNSLDNVVCLNFYRFFFLQNYYIWLKIFLEDRICFSKGGLMSVYSRTIVGAPFKQTKSSESIWWQTHRNISDWACLNFSISPFILYLWWNKFFNWNEIDIVLLYSSCVIYFSLYWLCVVIDIYRADSIAPLKGCSNVYSCRYIKGGWRHPLNTGHAKLNANLNKMGLIHEPDCDCGHVNLTFPLWLPDIICG